MVPKPSRGAPRPSRGALRPTRGAQPAQGPSPAQARPSPAQAWISGHLEILNLEIWKFGIPKNPKTKFSESKSVSPKMTARSGLVRKKSSWPHLGPFQAYVSMDRKSATKKIVNFLTERKNKISFHSRFSINLVIFRRTLDDAGISQKWSGNDKMS